MKKNQNKGFPGQLLDLRFLNGNLHPQKFFPVICLEAEKKTGAETFSFSGEEETKQLCVGEERRAFLFLLLSTSEREWGFL